MSRRNRKYDKQFDNNVYYNNATYQHYFDRIVELAVSMFEWSNLPSTVDERFLELTLCYDGKAVFFNDDVLKNFYALKVTNGGKLDVYGVPLKRRAYGMNGYNCNGLDNTNSVMIYNNYLFKPCIYDIEMYAKRLYNLDRIIDVNANAQKTPILIQCSETERLTMSNLYMQYDGNSPIIYGDKNLNTKGLTVLKTDAPYVCDRIYDLKTQIWNECLTYLGISNINIQKKERLITDEVTRNQGGTIASRYTRLEMRRQAVDKINAMFGLDIEVNYREDYQSVDVMTHDSIGDETVEERGELNE